VPGKERYRTSEGTTHSPPIEKRGVVLTEGEKKDEKGGKGWSFLSPREGRGLEGFELDHS